MRWQSAGGPRHHAHRCGGTRTKQNGEIEGGLCWEKASRRARWCVRGMVGWSYGEIFSVDRLSPREKSERAAPVDFCRGASLAVVVYGNLARRVVAARRPRRYVSGRRQLRLILRKSQLEHRGNFQRQCMKARSENERSVPSLGAAALNTKAHQNPAVRTVHMVL